MKQLIIYGLIAAGTSLQVAAQGLVNNGAQIIVTNGAYVNVVNGNTVGNYENRSGGWVNNAGTLKVEGNWINNGGNIVFTQNAGTVVLTGPNQEITGTAVTVFYNLTLAGTGTKTLKIDAAAGGAYGVGKNGILDLTSRPLDLNTFRFTQANPDVNSIQRSSGYIISETDATQGYGTLLRITGSTVTGMTYTYPFGRKDGTYIPVHLNFKQDGNAAGNLDSSGVAVSTFPTLTSNLLNNRPLPLGISHTLNEYNIENAENTLDRFWVSERVGYTSVPAAEVTFSYAEDEWDNTNSSTNAIFEAELGFIRDNSGAWDFSSKGMVDVLNNTLVTVTQPVFGVFTLANAAECPVADYIKQGDCAGGNILFVDSTTFRKGSILSHFWDFTDGNTATDSLTQHLFVPGTYQVQHMVTLNTGCTDTVTRTVTIHPKPVAGFTADTNHCLGQVMSFLNQSTSTPGNVNEWNWYLGNNTQAATQNTQIQYADTGKYQVKLVVGNNFGCRDSIEKEVRVFQNPLAAFETKDVCLGLETFLKNTSVGRPAAISSHEWNFGNGQQINGFEPGQLYAAAGNYTLTLSVKDVNNCRSTASKTVTVFPKAVADFTYAPQQITYDDALVQFTNYSQNANSYYWDLADGFSSAARNPSHTYGDTGNFLVTLIADNAQGCADTAVKNIYVEPVFTLFIPNAFTPGGGDFNETFGPEGLLMGAHDYEMTIFNRWGEKLFTTDDLARRWDGTFRGEPVQMDVYVYILRMKDYKKQYHNRKGNITLIR